MGCPANVRTACAAPLSPSHSNRRSLLDVNLRTAFTTVSDCSHEVWLVGLALPLLDMRQKGRRRRCIIPCLQVPIYIHTFAVGRAEDNTCHMCHPGSIQHVAAITDQVQDHACTLGARDAAEAGRRLVRGGRGSQRQAHPSLEIQLGDGCNTRGSQMLRVCVGM